MAANTPVMPPPPGVTPDFLHPEDVLHTLNEVTQYLCIVVVSIFVALRLVLKFHRYSRFDFEDYATAVAWLLLVGWCICLILLGKNGGGYHAWEVTQEQFLSFLKVTYAVTVIYVPMAFFVKIALLSIVIRVFSPDRKKVMAVYVILGTLLAYYIPAFIMKIFACRPISAFWNGGGWCLDQQKVIIADSVICMVSDFTILVLPLPLTWSLHISRAKKLRVMGILGAGGIATAFSVWRLVIMVQDGASPDYTLVFIRCVLTGNAEAGIGLICACLPVLSSYYSFITGKHSEPSHSQNRSYKLSSGQKFSSTSKFATPGRDFSDLSPDQAELICTVEGGASTESGPEESSPSLRSQEPTTDAGGIQKDVEIRRNVHAVRDG